MDRKILFLFSAVLLLLITVGQLTACSCQPPAATSSSDIVRPVVQSVKPPDSSSGVAVDSLVEVVFSEEIITSTVNPDTFKLILDGSSLAGSVTCSGVTARFKPTSNLAYSTHYTVFVSSGITDLQGNSLGQDFNWGFTTVSAPSTTASVSPSGSKTKTVTLSDADLPTAPISGMKFHFLSVDPEDKRGTAKIRASYLLMSYSIWVGVEDGKLFVYHLPRREDVPNALLGFYDSLGIDENTVYTPENGRYWFTGVPAWFDISKYDPEIKGIPYFTGIKSGEGQAEISYQSATP